MTAAAICFASLWYYAAIGRRLIAETTDESVVSGLSRRMIPGLLVNAAATLVALWSPYTALLLFAGTAFSYVFGSALFERD
jgi:hypothetical protein